MGVDLQGRVYRQAAHDHPNEEDDHCVRQGDVQDVGKVANHCWDPESMEAQRMTQK